MSDILKPIIVKLCEGNELSFDEMQTAFSILMSGDATVAQITSFMISLKMRGENATDIAAGASQMRANATRINAPANAIDIVGTGGDGAHSLNISTAAAIIVAGCNVPVAKHGNKAVSSKSGAADILNEMGINLECNLNLIEKAIIKAGICFLMAPRHHPALRHVGPTRVELGVRTIFNLLGPLSNPALVDKALIGVYDAKWARPFAEALNLLGTKHAFIVHGDGGLDEVSLSGPTLVQALDSGNITEFVINPSDFGVSCESIESIKGGDPKYNASKLEELLSGKTGPYRNIACMNAATALVATKNENQLIDAFKRAEHAIDTGAAKSVLNKLVQITNS